jgi:hypothetical protein
MCPSFMIYSLYGKAVKLPLLASDFRTGSDERMRGHGWDCLDSGNECIGCTCCRNATSQQKHLHVNDINERIIRPHVGRVTR